MNLEYKLNSTEHPQQKEITIYIENHIVNHLYFVILMQFDYFIRFLITMLMDIHEQYPLADIQFPIFKKDTLQNNFHLLLSSASLPCHPSIPSMSSEHLFQSYKYVRIMQSGSILSFQTPHIEMISRFNEIFHTSRKKYVYKLMKCVFDKLFLKLMLPQQHPTISSYQISMTFKPFQWILEEI